MKTRRSTTPQEFGHPELRPSRYAALYVAQAGWLVLGAFLSAWALWPSTCTPDDLIEIYRCSVRLPENRGWAEAALVTWLWATPLLLWLELRRRLQHLLDR